jgi:hypothetical protein
MFSNPCTVFAIQYVRLGIFHLYSKSLIMLFFIAIAMEGGEFLTDILCNGVHNEVDGDLAGLDDFEIPMTQETQYEDVEEVQATRSSNKSKRSKNFFLRKMKLYAMDGCTLARIQFTVPIKLVHHFGRKFMLIF